jgi:hypothetical protein
MGTYVPAKTGELDCNGFGTLRKEVRPSLWRLGLNGRSAAEAGG